MEEVEVKLTASSLKQPQRLFLFDLPHIGSFPIAPLLPRILDRTAKSKLVKVLVAPPGVGKTSATTQGWIAEAMLTPSREYEKKLMIVSIPTVMNAIMQYKYARSVLPGAISDYIACQAGGMYLDCQRHHHHHQVHLLFATTQSVINRLLPLISKFSQLVGPLGNSPDDDKVKVIVEELENLEILIDEAHIPSHENYILLALVNWLLSCGLKIRVIVATATPNHNEHFEYLKCDNKEYVNYIEMTQRKFDCKLVYNDDYNHCTLVSPPVTATAIATTTTKKTKKKITTTAAIHVSVQQEKSVLLDISRLLVKLITDQVNNSSNTNDSILVFVSGQPEAQELFDMLIEHQLIDEYGYDINAQGNDYTYQVIQCYGEMDQADMFDLINGSDSSNSSAKISNGFRIIIATNVAECGITLPDVTYVIDSGLVKRMISSSGTVGTNLQLTTQPISQDESKQRAGRAGRVRSGTYYFMLGSKKVWDALNPHVENDFFNSPKDTSVLQLLAHHLPAWTILKITPEEQSEIETRFQELKLIAPTDHKYDNNSSGGSGSGEYHVTDFGLRVANYPLPIRLAVTMMTIENELQLTERDSIVRSPKWHLMHYLIVAISVLSITNCSTPMWNVPMSLRKKEKFTQREAWFKALGSKFQGLSDICVSINVIVAMMKSCTHDFEIHHGELLSSDWASFQQQDWKVRFSGIFNPRTGPFRSWCYENQVNYKWMEQFVRVYKSLYFLILKRKMKKDCYLTRSDYYEMERLSNLAGDHFEALHQLQLDKAKEARSGGSTAWDQLHVETKWRENQNQVQSEYKTRNDFKLMNLKDKIPLAILGRFLLQCYPHEVYQFMSAKKQHCIQQHYVRISDSSSSASRHDYFRDKNSLARHDIMQDSIINNQLMSLSTISIPSKSGSTVRLLSCCIPVPDIFLTK
jgi:HrpA-like RNA helicase